jgi:glycosyltransferase involved in cell wall biosynthesis
VKQANAILSIITINYNDCVGLKKTVASVKSQSNQSFEYIIIDGGSTDGSAEYLREHENSFAYACSEKDKGIYDAQNKGIAKSTGKYLLFLNADDTFHSNQVVEQFLKQTTNSDKGIIYGNSLITSPIGEEKLLTPPTKLDLNFWYRNTLNHQAVFMQKTLFDKYGLYDLNFRICADFEFFLKVFVKENAAFEYLPLTVCNYFEDGFSANPANYDKMLAEKETVLKKHLSKKEYAQIRRAYVRSLPFRKQLLAGIYKTPVLNEVFRKIYPVISRSSK